MKLETMEKLRSSDSMTIYPAFGLGADAMCTTLYRAIADAIEAEVAEKCMELPVDADGVPIRVGDLMVAIGETEVIGVGPDYYITGERIYEGSLRRDGWNLARNGRHREPDTWGRIIGDAIQRGHDDDPSNIDVGRYVARCKALAERGE